MKTYWNALRQFTHFKGRTSRKEFWIFMLFHFLVANVLIILDLAFEISILYPLYLFLTMLPVLAINWRRMHDVGKAGWFAFIPVYGLLLSLKKGMVGRNEYGSTSSEMADA